MMTQTNIKKILCFVPKLPSKDLCIGLPFNVLQRAKGIILIFV